MGTKGVKPRHSDRGLTEAELADLRARYERLRKAAEAAMEASREIILMLDTALAEGGCSLK